MQIKRKGLIVSAGESRVVSASSLPSAIGISGDQRGAGEEEVSIARGLSVCVWLCASVCFIYMRGFRALVCAFCMCVIVSACVFCTRVCVLFTRMCICLYVSFLLALCTQVCARVTCVYFVCSRVVNVFCLRVHVFNITYVYTNRSIEDAWYIWGSFFFLRIVNNDIFRRLSLKCWYFLNFTLSCTQFVVKFCEVVGVG